MRTSGRPNSTAIHPLCKKMDARVKPAHDGGEQRFNSSGLLCPHVDTAGACVCGSALPMFPLKRAMIATPGMIFNDVTLTRQLADGMWSARLIGGACMTGLTLSSR